MAWTEKYIDLADGGAGDGSSGDPWASYTEALAELGAISAPTKIYVRGNGSEAGTVTFANDGTVANPVVWVGCTGTGATWTPIGDSGSAAKPTCTNTGQFSITGDYQTFDGLGFTSSYTGGSAVSVSSGAAGVVLHRCRLIATGANANARALTISVNYGLVEACYLQATATATYCFYTGASGVLVYGSHISGGDIGAYFDNNYNTIAYCIIDATDANDAIGFAYGGNAINNTIYAPGRDGIRVTSTAAPVNVLNNVIHSASAVGAFGVNSSAGTSILTRASHNMYYNCTGNLGGTPEAYALYDYGTAASDPLPNASDPSNNANDFDLASALRSNAFPGIFEAGQYAYTGALDHGALQLAGVTPDYPSEDDVRDGTAYGGAVYTGNMTLPAVADVRDGTTYGTSGTELTGEMAVYSTWTETEKSHIRYRLGIDGTEAAPTNTPTLGTITANVTQWSGTNVATPNVAGVPKVDVTHILGVDVTPEGTIDANVTTVSDDAITAAAIATGAIDADALAADAGTEIGAAVKTAIEAAGSHLTLILEDTGTTLPSTLSTISGYLDTEVAAILADTDELQKAITDGGRTDLLIDAIKAKTDLMLDQAAIRTAVGLASANLDTQIAGLSGYVDCLPATWVTVPTAAQNATAVRSELATELGRVDASVSSRAAAATALSNVTWTDTKAGYLDAPISEAGGGAGDGTGADEVTITWTSNGLPVGGGDVWITTDPSGDNVVAGTLQTNDNGQATFMLDDGSVYFLWGQRSGVNSIRGERFVAVAD